MQVWDYVLISIALAIMLAATFAVVRALFMRSESFKSPSVGLDDTTEAALLKLLAFDTSKASTAEEARKKLTEIFPKTFSEAESLSEEILLYRWGKGGAQRLFVFHVDTAPFDAGKWKFSPLGEIAEGEIYGRGALDDKGSLCAALRALELGEPKGEIIIYIATDEERGGDEYEKALICLKEHEINPVYIADEGGFIAYGDLCGLNSPAALAGISGTASAEFPPSEFESLKKSAKKIRLPRKIVKAQSAAIIPYCDFPARVVCGTGLPTARRALIKSLLPCACDGAFCEMDEGCSRLTCADERTLKRRLKKLRPTTAFSESAAQLPSDAAYHDLKSALAVSFGNMPVVPYLTHGATESDKFGGIAPVLKFVPIALDQAKLSSVHSQNERISRENLARAAEFYRAMFGIEPANAE